MPLYCPQYTPGDQCVLTSVTVSFCLFLHMESLTRCLCVWLPLLHVLARFIPGTQVSFGFSR